MALTVISRPIGNKLEVNTTAGTAIDDGSGVVFIYNIIPHGLITGDHVYIDSLIDSYNGFKQVVVYDGNSFFIRDGEGFDGNIPFKQEVELTYYKVTLSHGWQCVHLPIVYELETDLYPVNSVDTIFTGLTPYGGGAYINFTIPTGHGLVVLDYVLFKESISDVGAAYQVISITNLGANDLIVINKDNSGGLYSAQKIRNNYHIDVNVYAGLPSGHYWEDEKPYELAATLKFIPDSNNRIKFSISEILKGYIQTRNNLTLDTLPNNLDFFIAFYIEYAEGYDVSDGSEITAFVDEFTDDSEEFEGYAVNAMLPFKNLYSGLSPHAQLSVPLAGI